MAGFSDEDQEEGIILSFDSLREAFENVDSKDDEGFFDWSGESPENKRNSQTPSSWVRSSNLSVVSYDEDDDDENQIRFDDSDSAEEPINDESENQDDEFLQDETVCEPSAGISEEEPIKLNPVAIFEAMLFVGDKENRPLPPEKAANLMRNVSPEEIVQFAETLNARYAFLNCPYEVMREKSGFRLQLRSNFESVRTKFYGRIKEARLSQTAIDVLSIVAYKQPISAEEVEKILKQPTGSILSQLVRRDLLHVVRKKEQKSRTAYYQTTDRFLRLFGLENLDQLPIVDDLD